MESKFAFSPENHLNKHKRVKTISDLEFLCTWAPDSCLLSPDVFLAPDLLPA